MRILTDLTLEHFQEMARMESAFYGEENITPPEQAYEWYRKFPYTVVVAVTGRDDSDDSDDSDDGDERIVGFVNLFPVNGEVFARLKMGEFNDKNLAVDDIVDIGSVEGDLYNEPLHMFLSCIVVAAEYRKLGLTRKLLAAAIAQYEEVESRCDLVVIDNVTEAGRRFSMKYGFMPIGETRHDSVNFIQKYSDFCECVRMMN